MEQLAREAIRRAAKLVRKRRSKLLLRDLEFLEVALQVLRRQPGIHVRLPSHAERPFNAIDVYSAGGNFEFPTAGNKFLNVVTALFNGPGQVAVPDGWRAEIVELSAYVLGISDQRSQDVGSNAMFRVLKNGAPCLPYNNLLPTGSGLGGDFTPGGTPGGIGAVPRGVLAAGTRTQMRQSAIAVGIHLTAGDTLVLEMGVGTLAPPANYEYRYHGYLRGWMYPVRSDSDVGIESTLQD